MAGYDWYNDQDIVGVPNRAATEVAAKFAPDPTTMGEGINLASGFSGIKRETTEPITMPKNKGWLSDRNDPGEGIVSRLKRAGWLGTRPGDAPGMSSDQELPQPIKTTVGVPDRSVLNRPYGGAVENISGRPMESMGEEQPVNKPTIPERTASTDKITSEALSGGRTQYNTPEGPAIAGPERFFDANMREVAAGTPGARSGDELARRRMESESNAQYGIPPQSKSFLNIGGEKTELAGGRTLAEKEAAEGGGEFDFDKFHAALKAMGGNVGKKTALSVFEHMYGGHLEEQKARARMKELGLTHGPESPYAKNIASEIDYRSAQVQHMAQMAPLERQQKIEDIAHKIAETEAIPYQTALVKEHINYYKSISESPWMRENKGVMDVLLKEFEADPFSPEGKSAKAQLDGLVSQSIGRRAISASIAKMNETTGAKIDDPPIPGKIYEVPGKGRIRLNKDTQTWENLR